jgi:hypothetical protein
MHGNVPVRFGRGRLDSLGNKGLAAYLITSLRPKTRSWAKWVAAYLLHYDGFSLKLVPFVFRTDARYDSGARGGVARRIPLSPRPG